MSQVPVHGWSVQEALSSAESALAHCEYEEARCWLLYATTVAGFEAQAANEAQRAEFVETMREPSPEQAAQLQAMVDLTREMAEHTGRLPAGSADSDADLPIDDWGARARAIWPGA